MGVIKNTINNYFFFIELLFTPSLIKPKKGPILTVTVWLFLFPLCVLSDMTESRQEGKKHYSQKTVSLTQFMTLSGQSMTFNCSGVTTDLA